MEDKLIISSDVEERILIKKLLRDS